MSATTDKVKGTVNKAAGSVKEKVGEAAGDDRMAVDGAAQKRERRDPEGGRRGQRRRSRKWSTKSDQAVSGRAPAPIRARVATPRRFALAALPPATPRRGPKHETQATRKRAVAVLRTPSDLSEKNTRPIADALNRLVADFFALYIKTKNFHWHMSGPHFRDYHLLLDEQGEQIYASMHPLAERVRKLGQRTVRSIGEIAKLSRVKDNEDEIVDPLDMLGELIADNKNCAAAMRKAHELCDELEDSGTAGLLETLIDETERRTWFLFEASRQRRPDRALNRPLAPTSSTPPQLIAGRRFHSLLRLTQRRAERGASAPYALGASAETPKGRIGMSGARPGAVIRRGNPPRADDRQRAPCSSRRRRRPGAQ